MNFIPFPIGTYSNVSESLKSNDKANIIVVIFIAIISIGYMYSACKEESIGEKPLINIKVNIDV